MTEKRCETCLYYGDVVFGDRLPPGQCRRKAPGKYAVALLGHVGGELRPARLFTLEVVESPFPGVHPGDWCGEWARSPAAVPAEKACVACQVVHPADQFHRNCNFADGLDRLCKACQRKRLEDFLEGRRAARTSAPAAPAPPPPA